MVLHLQGDVIEMFVRKSSSFMRYRKILNISPGLIEVRKHFFGGLYLGGLYLGGSYSEGILC